MNPPSGKKSKTDGFLILEIGTEEIPSRLIPGVVAELEEKSARMLSEVRLEAREVEAMATPRRLTVRAVGIPRRQESRVEEVIGPPHSAAFDPAGRPTPAALGFARSQGLPVERLTVKETEKGTYVCAIKTETGEETMAVLRQTLPLLISSLVFPKMMRWNETGVKFARPVRWIMAIYNGRRVAFRWFGLESGNRSRGHRFLSRGTFEVNSWDGYTAGLKRRHVILDPAERKKIIRDGLTRLARAAGGRLTPDENELLPQAVFLTEDPVAMSGRFEPKFLELPSEVLISAMVEHQGYFPLVGPKGKLLPRFLFVANGKPPTSEVIQAGNERVLRARLEDARFYFEQDKKQTLLQRKDLLGGLIFHERLGTLFQKMERVRRLASNLAREAGRGEAEIDKVDRAALLSKSDLLTGVVREFPNLQGVMGREYALLEGEDPEVAAAIREHYFPRQSEDPNPPRTSTGKFLTAADRLDTLTGFFGVDMVPSGSMDPYALRRHGAGLIQVLLDDLFASISLGKAVRTAAILYSEQGIMLKKDPQAIYNELERFLRQRLEVSLKRRFEGEGNYRPDLAEAVLGGGLDCPLDLYLRFVALLSFRQQPEFEPLIVAFKRASRIVPKGFEGPVRPAEFRSPVEQALHEAYMKSEGLFQNAMAARRYGEALEFLTALRAPIDAFFNGVMVMDENRAVRDNRLALMNRISRLFTTFGDFTRVQEGDRART